MYKKQAKRISHFSFGAEKIAEVYIDDRGFYICNTLRDRFPYSFKKMYIKHEIYYFECEVIIGYNYHSKLNYLIDILENYFSQKAQISGALIVRIQVDTGSVKLDRGVDETKNKSCGLNLKRCWYR